MINRKYFIHSIITFGLILLCVLPFFYFDVNKSKVRYEKSHTLDKFLVNVVITKFDEHGQLHERLFAKKIEHYSDKKNALLTKPHLLIYQNKKTTYEIISDTALITLDYKKIVLKGHVKIHQYASKKSPETTMVTSELIYYPKKNLATTDNPITIQQDGIVIRGVGLVANTKESWVKILAKAKGTYEEQKAQTKITL